MSRIETRMRGHWMQRERKRNLNMISEWLKGVDLDTLDMEEFIRKCVLSIGCTRDTAKKYITEVTGNEW